MLIAAAISIVAAVFINRVLDLADAWKKRKTPARDYMKESQRVDAYQQAAKIYRNQALRKRDCVTCGHEVSSELHRLGIGGPICCLDPMACFSRLGKRRIYLATPLALPMERKEK